VRYRSLGRSGLQVSEIALGSWLTLGSSVDRAATRAIVQRAFELGVNLFDTADVYAEGQAEQALGFALGELPRHHLVLASKAFFPMSDDPNDRGLSRKHLFESVEGSLRRLGTNYLDLHQCHRADPETPLEETVTAYEDLVRQGKLLYWGVSEWPAGEITRACRIADARRGPRPISNQPEYSILQREIEREVLPACEREGIGQIVWSPLAQGVLSGKYAGGRRPAGTRGADPQRRVTMSDYLAPDLLERVAKLAPLAADLGLSPARLALAWCLRQTGVASAIVGVTRIEQIEDDVGASGVVLPPSALARIDELFPPPRP
jgi:aryl-alcohol dehydrogenase-like predicted oxidoreductase